MIYILAVSDEAPLYDNPVDFPRVDMLLSCGDLAPYYLSFLVDRYMPSVRIMVHGNHDGTYFIDGQEPVNLQYSEIYSGMFSIVNGIHVLSCDDYEFLDEDLSIGGFSGISAYGDQPFYHTDFSLSQFKAKLMLKKRFSSFSGVDIMLSHAPPDFGLITCGQGDHKPSEKLAALNELLTAKLWLYGHIHRRYTSSDLDFFTRNGAPLNLINACPFQYFSYDQKTGDIEFLHGPE